MGGQPKRGAALTHSTGGVPVASAGGIPAVGKGRKRRRQYPNSWGCAADQVKMKKRVMCVFDGSHRLMKDEMMLDNEFEVRMRLGDGSAYVTDLDAQTMQRAQAILDATEEEKGPAGRVDELDQLLV